MTFVCFGCAYLGMTSTDKENPCWYLSLISVVTVMSFRIMLLSNYVHWHEDSVRSHMVLFVFSTLLTLVGMMIAKDFHIFQVFQRARLPEGRGCRPPICRACRGSG